MKDMRQNTGRVNNQTVARLFHSPEYKYPEIRVKHIKKTPSEKGLSSGKVVFGHGK